MRSKQVKQDRTAWNTRSIEKGFDSSLKQIGFAVENSRTSGDFLIMAIELRVKRNAGLKQKGVLVLANSFVRI